MAFDAAVAARFLFEEGSESEESDDDLFFSDAFFTREAHAPASEASPRGTAPAAAFQDDEEDADARGGKQRRLLASREEIIIWAVDCSAVPEDLFHPRKTHAKQEAAAGESESVGFTQTQEENETTPWTEIMTACATFLKRKIISGQRLVFGLFLTGTEGSQNSLGFPHICAAFPSVEEVDVQTVQRVQALSRLSREDFTAEFGAPVARTKTECPPLADIFWLISHSLGAASVAHRRGSGPRFIPQRVLFFTADDDPCRDVAREARDAALQRLRDMQEDGVDFLLVPLESPGEPPFAMERFWGDALLLEDSLGPEAGDEGHASAAYKRQVRLQVDAINDNIRLVDRTQRVLSLLSLHLRPALELPVCLLSSVRAQPLPRPQAVLTADARQEPLAPGATLKLLGEGAGGEAAAQRRAPEGDSDEAEPAGEGLPAEDQEEMLVKKVQLLGPEAIQPYADAGGEKIGLHSKDMQAVKNFGPPGLWLLCCLPAKSLPYELNIASPLFVTTAVAAAAAAGPGAVAGTGREQDRLFSAFVMTLYKRKLAALVRYVPKHGSAVALAALLPQLEEVDEAGNTLQAPGLHLLRLPFAEDIRSLQFPWASLSSSAAADSEGAREAVEDEETGADSRALRREREEQVRDAMRVLVDLSVEDFHPHQLSNDALQRHFAIIEALALGAPEADVPPPTLVPDQAVLQKLRDPILKWKKSVYGTADEDFVPPTPRFVAAAAEKKTASRFAGSAGSPKKRPAPSAASPRARGGADEDDREGGEARAAKKPREAGKGRDRGGSVTDELFELLFKDNRLVSLTVAQLTAWIHSKGERPKGKKADLVQQAEGIWARTRE
ncbi:hypothetical protein BESB_005250 [Besnoitia besnoiti]|uniref:Ku domain-containing protein n=1 Tax=Besnoitia besnoiti TaxID=94643 RepID=A0A2A9MLN8_BESBE|nr:hypothetical protein BESB_005250 [Besnoitia besnoiti]PFH38184.1 hypothetical protein BESB_005250 [Besnoitia besnoiti]